jgi:hypothetical protein
MLGGSSQTAAEMNFVPEYSSLVGQDLHNHGDSEGPDLGGSFEVCDADMSFLASELQAYIQPDCPRLLHDPEAHQCASASQPSVGQQLQYQPVWQPVIATKGITCKA